MGDKWEEIKWTKMKRKIFETINKNWALYCSFLFLTIHIDLYNSILNMIIEWRNHNFVNFIYSTRNHIIIIGLQPQTMFLIQTKQSFNQTHTNKQWIKKQVQILKISSSQTTLILLLLLSLSSFNCTSIHINRKWKISYTFLFFFFLS